MAKQKIDDETLRRELLQNQKTITEVTEEYGYTNESSLTHRVNTKDKFSDLRQNKRTKIQPYGSVTINLGLDDLPVIREVTEGDLDGHVFYSKEWVDGELVVRFSSELWEAENQ